jgi:uncharacterized protein (TIGR03083 family)
MERSALWPAIHRERMALAADLEGMDVRQWSRPSLCREWNVRDVLAHMTTLANVTPMTLLPKLVSSGLSLGRMQKKEIGAARGASPSDTLAAFEAIRTSRSPPGIPVTMLGETLIHAEDIRRPLGIGHTYPIDAVLRIADFFKDTNRFIGTKRRVAGLRLLASDTAWSHGSGPEVSGPTMTLVLAMTGRKGVLDELLLTTPRLPSPSRTRMAPSYSCHFPHDHGQRKHKKDRRSLRSVPRPSQCLTRVVYLAR